MISIDCTIIESLTAGCVDFTTRCPANEDATVRGRGLGAGRARRRPGTDDDALCLRLQSPGRRGTLLHGLDGRIARTRRRRWKKVI